jgi:Leucine-rich repeat (LRR) protein
MVASSLRLALTFLAAATSLLIAHAAVIADCPATCSCVQNAQTLTLSCIYTTTVITLPNTATTPSLLTVTKILITGSTLTALPNNLCGYEYYLNYLDLSSNSISSTLTATQLYCLGVLTYLNLSQNQIATLQDSTFDYQTMLVTLDLSNNRLTSLPTFIFASNDQAQTKLPSLKYLYLQNNQIVSLDPWYFYLPAIVTINLANNVIATFTNNLGFSASNGILASSKKTLTSFNLNTNKIAAYDDYVLGN